MPGKGRGKGTGKGGAPWGNMTWSKWDGNKPESNRSDRRQETSATADKEEAQKADELIRKLRMRQRELMEPANVAKVVDAESKEETLRQALLRSKLNLTAQNADNAGASSNAPAATTSGGSRSQEAAVPAPPVSTPQAGVARAGGGGGGGSSGGGGATSPRIAKRSLSDASGSAVESAPANPIIAAVDLTEDPPPKAAPWKAAPHKNQQGWTPAEQDKMKSRAQRFAGAAVQQLTSGVAAPTRPALPPPKGMPPQRPDLPQAATPRACPKQLLLPASPGAGASQGAPPQGAAPPPAAPQAVPAASPPPLSQADKAPEKLPATPAAQPPKAPEKLPAAPALSAAAMAAQPPKAAGQPHLAQPEGARRSEEVAPTPAPASASAPLSQVAPAPARASASVPLSQVVGTASATPSTRIAKVLAKALASEPPHKKPRLELGEVEQWDKELQQLLQWLREKMPKLMVQPTAVKYSDEQMDSLEKYLQSLQAAT